MFELMESDNAGAVIKVIGVGGGGGNAVSHMVESNIEGVDFISANTDAQALDDTAGRITLQLGGTITKGLGAGANPEVGRQAALEDRDRIAEVLQGADMVFITAGMGGGTGTGAAPIIAQVAKEMDILTVAVVTKPFMYEGRKRLKIAEEGINELQQHVDSLITIPNEKLLTVMGDEVTLLSAFESANDVLRNAVKGIAELITRRGLINVDFADVRTVMSEMGMAMMGAGSATGPDRARTATQKAIASPLLDEIDLHGACGILVNVTAGMNLSISEFNDVIALTHEFASEDATVVVGTVIDPEMEDELRVTVVATGVGRGAQRQEERPVRLVREAGMRAVANGDAAVLDNPVEQQPYEGQSRPASMRASRSEQRPAAERDREEPDYFNIPAFLRRQAD